MLPNKILVIEDEPLIKKTTCMLLSNEKILTVSAETGAEGIDMARREKPDVVLLDMMLPDMDGWDVLRTLKSDPLTQGIPIIFFTAAECEVPETTAREQGAAGVLRKPFYPHQLLEIIKTL